MSDPTFGAAATRVLMLSTVAIWLTWDAVAIMQWGAPATISRVLGELGERQPAFAFALTFFMGVLIGHWFLGMRR